MVCEVCGKVELTNYCCKNVCVQCCKTGKCPLVYRCANAERPLYSDF